MIKQKVCWNMFNIPGRSCGFTIKIKFKEWKSERVNFKRSYLRHLLLKSILLKQLSHSVHFWKIDKSMLTFSRIMFMTKWWVFKEIGKCFLLQFSTWFKTVWSTTSSKEIYSSLYPFNKSARRKSKRIFRFNLIVLEWNN